MWDRPQVKNVELNSVIMAIIRKNNDNNHDSDDSENNNLFKMLCP